MARPLYIVYAVNLFDPNKTADVGSGPTRCEYPIPSKLTLVGVTDAVNSDAAVHGVGAMLPAVAIRAASLFKTDNLGMLKFPEGRF